MILIGKLLLPLSSDLYFILSYPWGEGGGGAEGGLRIRNILMGADPDQTLNSMGIFQAGFFIYIDTIAFPFSIFGISLFYIWHFSVTF
jgi:hypothetical protein